MAEPDIFDVVDAIVASGIEADPRITVDDAHARPPTYVPDTLYLYPGDENHVGYESGEGVRQNFRLWLDYAVDDSGERTDETRYAAVTQALRAKAKGYAEWVRTHQATDSWGHLRVATIDWLALSGLDYRGVRMRLDGYRIWD